MGFFSKIKKLKIGKAIGNIVKATVPGGNIVVGAVNAASNAVKSVAGGTATPQEANQAAQMDAQRVLDASKSPATATGPPWKWILGVGGGLTAVYLMTRKQ